MIRHRLDLAAALLLVCGLSPLGPTVASAKSVPGIDYVSPEPDAAWILEQNNIVLRPGGIVDGTSIGNGRLQVIGSVSGLHSGKLRLSDDHQTMTFAPDVPFVAGETVVCQIGAGFKTDKKGFIPPAEFSFTIAGPERDQLPPLPRFPEGEVDTGIPGTPGWIRGDSIPSGPPPVPLPADFPAITASVFGPTARGRIFLANFNLFSATTNPYLMILNNDGTPLFQRKLGAIGLDFKMQPNGLLTYFDNAADCFYAMNAQYAVVDSFRTGNGYATDGHDLVLLPNGHALLMSYDPELVDLSPIKSGLGYGIAVGLIVQELDLDKNVVFQWRSWDHFKITDAIARTNFGGGLDYVHGNSIDVGPDGSLLLSSRSMNELTKISRTTGDLLWRMGGKNNQFTFVDDPVFFTHQHSARWLPNGHITLFDNGNLRLPLFSRAVEYAVDEAAMTATMVWQYRLVPDVFAPALGYVQRLSNGNTLIGWGATSPAVTEIAPDNTIVYQLTFPPGVFSYRAFRFEWPPVEPALIQFQPASLNPGGLRPLLAVIQPIEASFALSDIDLSTVKLNGTLPAEAVLARTDANLDGIPDLTVQFPRAGVDALLSPGRNQLEVCGSLRNGDVFRGSGTIRVPYPTSTLKLSGVRVLTPAGKLPVELAAGEAGSGPRTVAIYDVQGRLVRMWRTAPGGRISWDGSRSNGDIAAAGIYFVRVDGVPGPASKLVIVR